jgi:hypothetical protein
MQVKRDDHTFSSKNCMDTKVHSAKTKIWASFHIPRRLHHANINEQSGFNVEQIEEDNYLESKPIWRINLDNKWTQQTKTVWLVKSRSNNKRRLHISQSSPLSSKTYACLLASKLSTCVTSQALNWEIIFSHKGFSLIEPMLTLHLWGQVT